MSKTPGDRAVGSINSDGIVTPIATAELHRASGHECLNSDAQTTGEASAIFRPTIDRIVLWPKEGRGKMLIEVYSRPEGLFARNDRQCNKSENWMIKVVAEDRYSALPTIGEALFSYRRRAA